jgi:hypothetical protein
MAERIVSPGVFTQERDQTFLAQGVAEIGAAFVGPTTKGPAFVATPVVGLDGFVTAFGEPDGTSYMGYTVKNYLQEAGSATIVRVLGLGGYTTTVATVFVSGSTGDKVFAVLHPTISGSSLTPLQASVWWSVVLLPFITQQVLSVQTQPMHHLSMKSLVPMHKVRVAQFQHMCMQYSQTQSIKLDHSIIKYLTSEWSLVVSILQHNMIMQRLHGFVHKPSVQQSTICSRYTH